MNKNNSKEKNASDFFTIFKECQRELDIAEFEADYFGYKKPDPIKIVDKYFKNQNAIVKIGGKYE
tara:strand:- start:5534 stop:5728 length:195 start_codon:yes stop_codon:yes gene_type:complete